MNRSACFKKLCKPFLNILIFEYITDLYKVEHLEFLSKNTVSIQNYQVLYYIVMSKKKVLHKKDVSFFRKYLLL